MEAPHSHKGGETEQARMFTTQLPSAQKPKCKSVKEPDERRTEGKGRQAGAGRERSGSTTAWGMVITHRKPPGIV